MRSTSRLSEVAVRSLGEVGQLINMSFFYVYVLQLTNGDFYVGRSDNLKRRIGEHLRGEDITTSKFLPLKLVTYLAFDTKTKAVKFEKYLKTGSGIAFRRKHF